MCVCVCVYTYIYIYNSLTTEMGYHLFQEEKENNFGFMPEKRKFALESKANMRRLLDT